VDEKSQIQALDRTQPGLPLKKGRCGTMTHDYKRNGTTTLFAAFNVLEGSVIGRCMQRHTHQEFIRFLNAIENQVPANKQVHVVLDNYATHKHPKVVEWLGRHERFTFHFTPTSASWINAVEGFFAKLTNRRLKRGVFHSIVALQAAINRFVREANENPKPFRWTKDPDEIIAAVRRGHQALVSVRKLHAGLQSFRSMRRMEARRRNARAVWLRFSQSRARRRHRLSHAMVRSTIQRLGSTTKPFACLLRLTISTARLGIVSAAPA
jgi:transposase